MHERDDLRAPVAPGIATLGAEIVHVIRHEMAVRLSDVVIRRTGLGAAGPPDDGALAWCAAIAARELGWSAARTDEEVAAVKQFYAITLTRVPRRRRRARNSTRRTEDHEDARRLSRRVDGSATGRVAGRMAGEWHRTGGGRRESTAAFQWCFHFVRLRPMPPALRAARPVLRASPCPSGLRVELRSLRSLVRLLRQREALEHVGHAGRESKARIP